MKHRDLPPVLPVLFFLAILLSKPLYAWSPMAVDTDPLVRMPGTQPSLLQNIASPSVEEQGGATLQNACINCHKGDPVAPADQGMPFFQWQGSMMAQAARDPIFWATMTVAAQDSIWAIGRPNATDICLRCHFPEGWLGDRSDQLNGSAMTGSDFDGVHCAVCHRLYDPFAKATNAGTREGGADQAAYWDETTIASQTAADATAVADFFLAGLLEYMNGSPLYINDEPAEAGYTGNGSGQMFIDLISNPWDNMRGPFADPETEAHGVSNPFRYSRYHKSKFICSTCHDVSNPVLANLGDDPADGLLTEQQPASSYYHVERTFSEFMSSAYGSGIGTSTNQEFQDLGGPGSATRCQDCHLPDVQDVTAASGGGVVRPSGSTEHPNSGVPAHDLQGGNLWMTRILASLDDSLGVGVYDATNVALLNQGPATLTLDLTQGISPMFDSNGEALMAASDRARTQLQRAATIKNLSFNTATGDLSFQVQNNTGHKLLTGYPEGRRMYVNVQLFLNGALIYEINPYDPAAGTLKGGLSYWNYNGDPGGGGTVVSAPTALGINEEYADDMVYEANTKSSLTGEDHTFHFALATDRYKDNRIPPKGFNLAEAKTRLCEPVASGGIKDDPSSPGSNLYSTAEYNGGYDEVTATIPPAIASIATDITVTLYYQGTSREYIEFLRDEINGTGANRALFGPDNVIGAQSLTYAQSQGLNPDADNAYLAQTDPFFSGLKAWGSTIWELWAHNHGLDGSGVSIDGIVPLEMTTGAVGPGSASYTMEMTGEGKGAIVDIPSGTTLCSKTTTAPATCIIPFLTGSQINIRAVKYSRSAFDGFTAAATINGNDLTDTVTADETIQAAFSSVPGMNILLMTAAEIAAKKGSGK